MSWLIAPTFGQQNPDIQAIVNKAADQKLVYGTVVSVFHNGAMNTYSAGNFSQNTPYFAASITKMYTTAVVMKLRSLGQLALDDPIGKYLAPEVMEGLHVYQGVDHSAQLTLRHLLTQTSGLPDYYEGERPGKPTVLDELLAGKDQYLPFEEVVAICKAGTPAFAPGEEGKAFYSDTNWRLVQQMLENITDTSIMALFEEYIFQPLALEKTYVFTDILDSTPAPLFYKREPLYIPKAMSSFHSDGGIVTTAEESLLFLKAFYTGKLFPKEYLGAMKDWNNIMNPLQYGTGMMRLNLPQLFTGGKNFDLMGHAGSSGAFAFYDPDRDIYLAGTVNQMHKRGTSFQLMMKVLNKM